MAWTLVAGPEAQAMLIEEMEFAIRGDVSFRHSFKVRLTSNQPPPAWSEKDPALCIPVVEKFGSDTMV